MDKMLDTHVRNGDYLAAYGNTLIEQGYEIVPIKVGSKAPGFDGWQKVKANARNVTNWLNNGHEHSGVGILTAHTPAIDLDIYDSDMAERIEKLCIDKFGAMPIRVGKAPKRLLVFRTDEPFKKLKTGKFEDEWGDQHEVEILGEGQQFVAYAIHKDTGLPYKWTTDVEPINTPVDELKLLTLDDMKELIQEVVEIFTAEGWSRKSKGKNGNTLPATGLEDDDPMASDGLTVDISDEELFNQLMLVPDAGDYDTWTTVGMSLYHQYDGDQRGLDMWLEWSETADNFEHEVCVSKWPTFAFDGKGGKPVTARYILKLAKAASTTMSAEVAIDLRHQFVDAKTIEDWYAVAEKVKRADLNHLSRADIVEFARKKYGEIMGSKLPIQEMRKALAYEQKVDKKKPPSWVGGWVFDASEDRFFHLLTKTTMSMQAFNLTYSRNALTKSDRMEGKTSPSSSPVELAMNLYEIPVVNGRRYSPGDDDMFLSDGIYVANTYPTHLIPEVPSKLKPFELKAIERVRAHIAHLIEDEGEQKILLNWLAWVVQNPGNRVNWAVVLQGVEGDGKSFFGFLLRAVMGQTNVRMLNANVLDGTFTGWAHGQCVTVIEEPRLHGANKYDVLNKMKTYITNPIVEVHPKGRDPYNVKNTVNYFIPTNFRDALPIIENDRRYCVLFSRWQDGTMLREFVANNPNYYAKLYETLERAAPALRKWLLELDIPDDFPAGGIAPLTRAHSYMVAASQPEAMRAMNEIIKADDDVFVSRDLINATMLPESLLGFDIEFVNARTLSMMLEQSGYTFLGRIKDTGGKWSRYWSKRPERFRLGVEVAPFKIRQYVHEREKSLKTKADL